MSTETDRGVAPRPAIVNGRTTWAQLAADHHDAAVHCLHLALDPKLDLAGRPGEEMRSRAQVYATLAVAAATRADTEARGGTR